MNAEQRAFLEHIGMLIPQLFEAIRLGNVKSECVLGDRIIGKRQVRLKLVAEVVDPGSNPLATHSQRVASADSAKANQITPHEHNAAHGPTTQSRSNDTALGLTESLTESPTESPKESPTTDPVKCSATSPAGARKRKPRRAPKYRKPLFKS